LIMRTVKYKQAQIHYQMVVVFASTVITLSFIALC
jgi:hypothetical protein